MNFGDILDQWDAYGNAHEPDKPLKTDKQKNGAEQADKAFQTRVNPMDEWLRVNGVIDKDSQPPQNSRDLAERRRRLRHKKPDAEIDIHGLTRDEAWDALEQFFAEARRRALEKVLVIHGKGSHSKGEAVLKIMTRQFIERCVYAGESGQGTEGGSGATWVILKQK